MLKIFSAIFLVIGTTIGAGMLALPMVTAKTDISTIIITLFVLWLIMLVPAFYILEVLLLHPSGTHLVSMAKSTLGVPGMVLLWITNCLLLFSVLAAYISGGGEMLNGYLLKGQIHIPINASSVIFALIMSLLVVTGIRVTGVANSIFMVSKSVIYLLLIIVMFFHINVTLHQVNLLHHIKPMILTGVLSFSYAMLLPTLHLYLGCNTRHLKIVIMVGSIIPLIVYFLWIIAVRLVVPLEGADGLHAVSESASVYLLAKAIGKYAQTNEAVVLANGFTTACLLTTFLGVSLVLSDIIADGMRVAKKGWGGVLVYSSTYVPPLILVVFLPKLFVIGINYAGLLAILYLLLLPCSMAYSSRYVKNMRRPGDYQFWGGRPMLLLMISIGLALFAFGIWELAR